MDTEISTENECEIEHILNSPCLIEAEVEKPLSPILHSSLNRKCYGSKKQRKSRIKLGNIFDTEKKKEELKNEQSKIFSESSFSLDFIENEDLMECLNKLEQIEKNREIAYKTLVTNRKSDLCFKKPTSPAPKTPKKFKTPTNTTIVEQNHAATPLNNEIKTICTSQQKPIILPTISNFQTATGKNINLTSETINKHSKIFEDILSNSQIDSHRQNKFNFLTKTNSTQNNVSDTVLNNNHSFNTDTSLSETQMIFAVEEALNNLTDTSSKSPSFKGFSNKDLYESEEIRDKFYNFNLTKNNKIVLPKKRTMQETEFVPNKKLKTEFNSTYEGFTMSSGKKVNISSNILSRRVNLFKQMDTEFKNDQNFENNIDNKQKHNSLKQKINFFDDFINGENKNNDSLAELSKTVKLSDNNDKEKPLLKQLPVFDFGQFTKASGNKITINPGNLNKACDIFNNMDLLGKEKSTKPKMNSKDENMPEIKNNKNQNSIKEKLKYFDQIIGDTEDFMPKLHMTVPSTSTNTYAQKNKLSTNKKKLEFFDNLLGKDDVPKRNNSFQHVQLPQTAGTFSSASGKSLQLSNSALKKASSIFDDICKDANSSGGFFQHMQVPPTTGTFSSASGKSLQLSNSVLKKASSIFDDILCKDTNSSDSFTTPVKSFNESNSSIKKAKRTLGVSSLKQIPLEATKLQKARLLFDEDLAGISPIKDFNNFKNFNACSTPIQKQLPAQKSFCSENETIPIEKTIVNNCENNFELTSDSIVTFNISVPKDVGECVKEFENEVKMLEERLTSIKKRKEVMETMVTNKLDCDKKPIEGVLYKAKKEKNRMSLNSFVNGENPGNTLDGNLFCITPQNATNIHFKESSAMISTEDGATVVPNTKDLIGVAEIEYAFKAMPGVDPRLIPKNWLQNHYKWIIWKLASYQRVFPNHFKESLTVEQVIQQLKYRYDREIDKAERSAIRKILEKDDAPQKRMILCVSDIKSIECNAFELELTDGWYGIRTVIDERLCHQIMTKKIKVGTKLITCGAELINCDGCHPLDVTNLTYLKINFNRTRRARWDSRLGYQNYPGPFPIAIHTIHPNGGAIGRIDICIARSYPFRYLDKSQAKSVWRNKKAEERRAQNWENERYKKLEALEENLRKEYFLKNELKENSNKSKLNGSVDICAITCPKTLLEIVESSNDPDSIKEKLTSSQNSSLLEYERQLFAKKQQELAAKIKDGADKLKLIRSETLPVLKLLVVDLNGSPTKAFNLFLWKPTEDHVQSLKENTCVAAFNIFPKTNGDLHSGAKTMFEPKPNTNHMSEIFKRKLIPIAEVNDFKFSQNFNEFDTVGVVVRVQVEDDWQEVWLTDLSGRLLLIKVSEGPSTCLLLDNLKRGQTTSVCNLIYRGLHNQLEICRAAANHFTVFSLYPKYKHLQDGLDSFKKDLPKEFDDVLRNCDNQIDKFKSNQYSNEVYESDEDSTLVSSRITSTDIALSLILDQFT